MSCVLFPGAAGKQNSWPATEKPPDTVQGSDLRVGEQRQVAPRPSIYHPELPASDRSPVSHQLGAAQCHASPSKQTLHRLELQFHEYEPVSQVLWQREIGPDGPEAETAIQPLRLRLAEAGVEQHGLESDLPCQVDDL